MMRAVWLDLERPFMGIGKGWVEVADARHVWER
jgi:hypothetical protein